MQSTLHIINAKPFAVLMDFLFRFQPYQSCVNYFYLGKKTGVVSPTHALVHFGTIIWIFVPYKNLLPRRNLDPVEKI